MTGPRVSLSKKHLDTPAGVELLKLCQTIKADGRLSKAGIISLAHWLGANKGCGLPAVDYLHDVVSRIVADGRVTVDEMKELHEAIERIMPGDARKTVIESRKAIEKAKAEKKNEIERAAREAEKQAERARNKEEREQERQRKLKEWANRPHGFHSKLHGVTKHNDDGSDRQALIRDYVRPGMQLIVKREPDNPHDEFAISLWIKTPTLAFFEKERQIGYLISYVAEDLAPYLDKGGWVRITVKEVTGGGDQNYGVNIFIEDGREER